MHSQSSELQNVHNNTKQSLYSNVVDGIVKEVVSTDLRDQPVVQA